MNGLLHALADLSAGLDILEQRNVARSLQLALSFVTRTSNEDDIFCLPC
jgi:hypothetical protein